jgi:imidazolonepropionase-like amidohydrolase
MYFNPLLDSFYALGSLWGGLIGTGVCASSPRSLSGAPHEAVWSPRQEAAAGVAAFVAVNVVPMDTERVLPNHTVLVQDGRITALGPADKVPVPAGAVRIDGRGRYLMPGLADMHWHSSMEHYDQNRLTYLAHGITSLRNIGEEKQLVRPFDAAKVLGPRLYTSFTPFTGDLTRPDSAAAYLAAQKAAGYDFLLFPRALRGGFVFPRLTRATGRQNEQPLVDSLLAAARRLGFPVASHEHEAVFEETLAFGAAGGSSEHLYSYLRALVEGPEWQTADVPMSKMQTFAAAVQRAGVWLTPTLNCMKHRSEATPSGMRIMRQLVKALQDAGAGLLLGGDGGHLQDELAELVRAGLTPYQALLTGTRNVAAFYKMLDSSGTVAVGKRADLVLLYGNPLQDIRHTREPAGVMLAGRWLDRAALDQGLLASPRSSLLWSTRSRIAYEQKRKVEAHAARVADLMDSVRVATSLKDEGGRALERVLQLLVNELVAMRAALPSENHQVFDPIARAWMREQSRQGHRVVVPGIAPVP